MKHQHTQAHDMTHVDTDSDGNNLIKRDN